MLHALQSYENKAPASYSVDDVDDDDDVGKRNCKMAAQVN